MAKIHRDQPLIPSVLDRLIDHEPGNQREVARSRGQILRDLKASVRNDLEKLLNSRWRCVSWPADLDQLDLSLVNYGIPDFTGASMGQASQREKLRNVMEQVIRKFEPRFKSVSVKIRENADPSDRTLRLRIDAVLYAEPAPEPVVFDSQLAPASATFEITTGAR